MALDILILFFSFIYGNLLIVNSNFLIWNIVSIFKLILIFELFTWLFLTFSSKEEKVKTAKKQFFFYKWNIWASALSLIKRGLLLGIFIEAFKVGS